MNKSLHELKIRSFPPVKALKATRDDTISASTEIVLQPDTSLIRVCAIAKDVYLKWGTDDVTNANFDHIILAGTCANLEVPGDTTAINVLEAAATGNVVVTEY